MSDKTNSKIDIINNYIDDCSYAVSKTCNLSPDRARTLVSRILKNANDNETVKNPTIKYYGKDQYGDRVERSVKATKYFEKIVSGGDIVVPSGTVYKDHNKKLSILASSTGKRVKARGILKKEAFLAESRGDLNEYELKESLQKSVKTKNNGFTGMYDNPYNPFYCPSNHSSLTSTTASVTSIGNSIGESMTAGNRIYTTPEIPINHIISLMTNSDMELIKEVCIKYNLYTPTVDDCMFIILKSTRFYWYSIEKENEIREILDSLTGIERAAFCYINDFYHLRYFNPTLVRTMFNDMLGVREDLVVDYKSEMSTTPEDVEILAKTICYDTMFEHAKKNEVVNMKDDLYPITKNRIASTAFNIKKYLNIYDDLIRAFFLTDNLPINIADIKLIVRKCTILSDTDSTCATYQDWVLWYFKRPIPIFTSEEIGLSSLVLLMMSRTLAHSLELFSRRMNIKAPYTKLLAMKNEFYWKIMVFMNMTKHYYADTAIREGNVFGETKLELKGSNLINSKLPASIKKLSDGYFVKINKIITSGSRVNIHDLVSEIVAIEKDLMNKFINMESEMMKEETILHYSSYKGEKMTTKYYHFEMWNEVFGPKYGIVESTPIVTIKVKTSMDTNKRMYENINAIEDVELKNRWLDFLARNPRNGLEVIRLPKEKVNGVGIPMELQHMLVIKPAIEELCSTFYLLLESLGFFKKPGMLLSDMYK